MPTVPAPDLLARLVTLLETSPASYLADSGLWSYPGPEEIRTALADVVREQRSVVERASEILQERHTDLSRPAFPMAYTGWHDVDLRFLLPRVIESLRRQAAECDTIAVAAGPVGDRAAAELAEDAASVVRRHLGRLVSLAAAPAAVAEGVS
jgi:hypothetical protein